MLEVGTLLVESKPHPVFDDYFNVEDVGDATLILK